MEKVWDAFTSFWNIRIWEVLKEELFGNPIAFIDIVALAVVFYFIYRFARKRRAFKLVMGVVVFLAVIFIGNAMELTAMKFVFGNFAQLGVLAIVIIFQPELRSALEKIGGTAFTGLQSINHDKKGDVNAQVVVDAVSLAAQRLSSIGHGALMVIERNNDLEDFKRTGTSIDAAITPDLLCSIFYKGGALHDGAVVISNGRVDTAGCVIRVTDRTDIDSSLGTRHRAAIGTTEVSDAIIVVVSEETGTISISADGKLERGFGYRTLHTRLEEMLDIVPAPKRKRRQSRIMGKSRERKADAKPNGENQNN